MTPLYKKLKENGTTTYVFPGASEDISASYQNQNYKMYFSRYVLLNLPKQTTPGLESKGYFNFDTFKGLSDGGLDFNDAIIESLRNYVANSEMVIRNSRLNNKDYYYDPSSGKTVTEKIFFRWCKSLNLLELQLAKKGDDYLDLPEFSSNNEQSNDFFEEFLWRERLTNVISVFSYYETPSNNFNNKLELKINRLGLDFDFRVGDRLKLSDFSDSSLNVILPVLEVRSDNNFYYVVLDKVSNSSELTGGSANVKLVYNRLVQYIGEVNGVSNVQESTKSYTEVYAHIPAHGGLTPDILFRTLPDINWRPSGQFPILPGQLQPEILGAESFNSPIVKNNLDYPGGYFGQFDTDDFTYKISNGDSIRRSGDFFGVSGNRLQPQFKPEKLDGLEIDFNRDHYSKMNIFGKEVLNFDSFNALELLGQPPLDFEFNAILWYYTIENSEGEISNNLYGISFLNNPDTNPDPNEVGLKFPTYKKLVSNGRQDGTSYAFSLNLNFNVVHEDPQEAWNPEAINSLFSMNLFNEAMSKLSQTNDAFSSTLREHSIIKEELTSLKSLLYTQVDIRTLNRKIENLERLINLYSTQQIVSSSSIGVNIIDGTPSKLELVSIDSEYSDVFEIKTKNLYTLSGDNVPFIVNFKKGKKFLIRVLNNDDVDMDLDNNLKIIINGDLDIGQSFDVFIDGDLDSKFNKKLDIVIRYIKDGENFEETLISSINLPIYRNSASGELSAAYKWNSFNLNPKIETFSIENGDFEFLVSDDINIVSKNLSVGDYLVIDDLFLGITASVDNYSFQSDIKSIIGDKIILNLEGNILSTNQLLSGNLLNKMFNVPKIKFNKGSEINIIKGIDNFIVKK
jgi:hypothetical protein